MGIEKVKGLAFADTRGFWRGLGWGERWGSWGGDGEMCEEYGKVRGGEIGNGEEEVGVMGGDGST
jgi:hypothetical protein